jgi:hypothetical protein
MERALGVSSKPGGALYQTVGDDGQPVYMTSDQAAGRTPYQKPERAPSYAPQSAPSAVQNYEYFRGRSPEAQAEFLRVQRGTNATPETQREAAAARAEGTAEGTRAGEVEKRIAAAQNMGDALDLATPLVAIATGSGVGALADRAAGLFGYTPTGAEAVAALRVLGQKVLENVPRMEGPQSDADRKMYQEAAGQLGDPSVTRGSKMAAIREIRKLMAKYAARNAAIPASPGTGQAEAGVVDWEKL